MTVYNSNRWKLAALAAALTLPGAAFAQQAANSDPYAGVSQPPPDSTISASPDEVQTVAPPPPAAAKPSPYVPAQSAAPAPRRAQVTNPDYDVVSSVPAQDQEPPEPAHVHEAVLESRQNPDYGIVSSVPSNPNELSEGTDIRVRLITRLSTNETTAGSSFRGQVATDVYKDGRVIIPAGSELKGRVVGVRQGHHFTGAATLRLRPDMVILPDGTAYHLFAQVAASEAKGTRTDSEGGIQPKSHLVKDTVEYGAGAGTGAIVGAHFGPEGALVGAIAGAGVITAHLLMQHPEAAVVPQGSVVIFSLSEPMELTPTRN
ncbi:hypothetical protein [Silvibacterium acidisoli]|uniref:hypothetical protein n=1 Tax=Acidobacteriaceae bacterium ZG23-2 TaxID=2883246 RepID=UPI00406C3CD6